MAIGVKTRMELLRKGELSDWKIKGRLGVLPRDDLHLHNENMKFAD
ncbi:MAG: hypothetical protein ACI9FG_000298 [Crocinitomicaceae bacterium]|jgi:hypothetical protein